MTWGKVDDQLYSSPKWLAAPPRSRGLWVTAMSWSLSQLTDGHVPMQALPLLGARKPDAEALVKAGLWEHADGGYQFHDWAEYQPDAASIRAKRSAESAGGREGNHNRWHVKRGIVVPDCEFCRTSGTRSGTRRGTRFAPDSGANPPGPVPHRTTDGLTGAVSQEERSSARDNVAELETYAPRARSLDGWKPSERCRRVALTKSLDIDEQRELFSAHARTHNRQVADWDAAFESWLLKSAQLAKAGARPLDRQAEILRREMEAARAWDEAHTPTTPKEGEG